MHDENAPSRCTAHLRGSGGKRCKKHAELGYKVCRLHGGKTPRGWESANTKHGRYSADLPTRLADRYNAALGDPDLVNLSSEIALLDARIGEVIGKLGTGEAGAIWRDLRVAHGKLLAARKDNDTLAMVKALTQIDTLVADGAADYQQWSEIVGLIDQRRKLVEAESKREALLRQNITVENAMLLVGLLRNIIFEEIVDVPTRMKIGARLREITAGSSNTPGGRAAIVVC